MSLATNALLKSVHLHRTVISCFSCSFFLLVNMWCFFTFVFSFIVMNMPTNCQDADVLGNLSFFLSIHACSVYWDSSHDL